MSMTSTRAYVRRLMTAREGPLVHRPLVIPMYPDVEAPITSGSLRTAGMSRKRYFELLDSWPDPSCCHCVFADVDRP